MNLRLEAASHVERRQADQTNARRMAAFFIAFGIDLDAAMDAPPPERALTRLRLRRLLERERLRGAARHWSYDLNRHIALKQALDALGSSDAALRPTAAATAVRA